MAAPYLFLFFSSSYFLFLCNSQAQISKISNPLVLPVTKDPATLQYLTNIYLAAPLRQPIGVVVDIGGSSLWLDCASGSVSSSVRPVRRCSIQCLSAGNGNGCVDSSTSTICDLSAENGVTRSAARGELVEATLAGGGTGFDRFLFSCAPSSLLKGLAVGARGMLGLGRTRIAMTSQLASAADFHRRFALCLPSSSSPGLIVSGNEQNLFSVSRSLTYTPLIQRSQQPDYLISVSSIKINGKRLSLGSSPMATKIVSTVPFTLMESSIFATFVKAYEIAASGSKMTRVAPVAPFDLCFGGDGVAPEIDLVLQSEMVKWTVESRNSMVKVSDAVMCLGFVDGGSEMETAMVLGGHQLEDVLVQIDLGNSMLGFSSSLLRSKSSCSQLRLELDSGSAESL